ncbi:hypothetical protein D3C85_1311260 [compost metagenome]
MTVMGGIMQGFVEFLPLLAQAFLNALAQSLEQTLTLRGPQKTRKGIKDDQQLRKLGTGRDRRISFGHLRQPSLRGFGLVVLQQVGRQHFTIAPRRGQVADAGGRRFQLLDAGQSAQWPQQTAQTAHRGPQVMQGFRVGTRT